MYEIKEENQKRHLLSSYEALLQRLQAESPIKLCFGTRAIGINNIGTGRAHYHTAEKVRLKRGLSFYKELCTPHPPGVVHNAAFLLYGERGVSRILQRVLHLCGLANGRQGPGRHLL